MTISAISVLRVQVVLWARRLNCTDVVRHAVAGQAKLRHPTGRQHTWICGTMRCMTGNTAFSLHRRMLVDKRTLFVRMTSKTCRVCACRESCLLQLKATMRIVTVTALHRPFQHFVMGRQIELVLDFRVATQTELWLVHLQQFCRREARFLSISVGDKNIRVGEVLSRLHSVGRMAIDATNVVTPMLAAPEVVVLFLTRVTGKTSLRNLFWRFILIRDHPLWIAFFDMCLAWTMTRLATRHLIIPTLGLRELKMRRVRESLELIFVAVLTSITADVVSLVVLRRLCLTCLTRLTCLI